MSDLKTYNKKRDFSQTSEPKAGSSSEEQAGHRFVVQRHDASRLHYDFRLEIAGALKSWAVPKGPSMNPKDRRLAVQVEDHPLSYGSFEGEIPKGNYGAGTVSIFDEGEFLPLEVKSDKEFLAAWKNGNIKFQLKGKILKGDFALVRMKADSPENWLLIKHKDSFSSEKAFSSEDYVSQGTKDAGKAFKKKGKLKSKIDTSNHPATPNSESKEYLPMLAKLEKVVPDSNEWLYEKKFDGFRALSKLDKKPQLISRNGKNLNSKFPSILKDLLTIKNSCILDGEIVIENNKGLSQFQLLQSGEDNLKDNILKYYVFDILELDGHDLRMYSLLERKQLLKLLMDKYEFKHLEYVEAESVGQSEILEFASKHKWEGIIAKMKESTYQGGKRNGNWLKIKLRQTQEAIICGFTKPEGSRSYFGAIVLGLIKNNELKYIGNCGTGFNEKSLKDLYAQFEGYIQEQKPFKNQIVAKEKQVTWLTPSLVCDVYYSEWTNDEHLRHPVFKGLREDKSMEDVSVEDKEGFDMEKDKELKFGNKKVRLSNLDKIYWPKEGISKGDLLNYYEWVSDYILPFLKDKPISMNRFPNGIESPNFFQKDVDPAKIPNWLKTTEVFSESTNKTIDYLLCNDKASLLYIVNLGSIEINPWLSTYKKPNKPEFVVLDLDPNGAKWEDVISVALTAKSIFDHAEIPTFIKTSGSSGLHILVYLGAKYEYEIARNFMQFIAEMIHQEHNNSTSIVRDPKKRKGLIYLDYLQNKEGQTIVAPYSARPKPLATVSTPLNWEEVTNDLSIQDFTIFNIKDRVENIEDPWKNIRNSKVDIKKALSKF